MQNNEAFDSALRAFLVAAKCRTYAAGTAVPAAVAALPGSKQLEYSAGGWLYRDIYFGNRFFAGQETVYHEGVAVWAMVYAGGLTDRLADPGVIYPALQQALLQVPEAHPFRGPAAWTVGALTYTNRWHGTLHNFWGVESILDADKNVYTLRYSGGQIC